MKNYLPSKQFIKTILGATFLALILFFGGNFFNKKISWEQKNKNVVVASQDNQDFFSRDSDGDGLYDWEEVIWGTDLRSVDSSGDGISDYEYVKNIKKNINFEDIYKSEDGNQTQNFAKQFFVTASALNGNQALSQDQIEQFGQGFSASINAFSLEDKYSISDLKLSNISAKEYYNSIINLRSSLENQGINELMLIGFILENPNDVEGKEELGNLLNYYQKNIDGLLSINVPHANAANHLSIINNIYKVSQIMQQVNHLENDPLKVMSYLSRFDEYSDKIYLDYRMLESFFRANGVI